jgi:hypothetical protein
MINMEGHFKKDALKSINAIQERHISAYENQISNMLG